MRIVVAAVVVVVLAFVGVQWFRSVPAPAYTQTFAMNRIAGRAPSLPWPTSGEAAVDVPGVGSLGSAGPTTSLPIASITKVMTAYVVLHTHPLAPGASGPAISVTAADVAAYKTAKKQKQSVVAVSAGEKLSERQALEGLLIPSGNNLARLLADWDAGSTTAFVAKMNATAQSLGLGATHFAGPSGLNPGSVSTAADLVRLGQAAMGIPAFAHIVAMAQVTLPVAGLQYNFDYALGHDGIVGIKTGTDGPSGGCFLFESVQTLDGHTYHVVGAVLGQGTTSPITAALDAGEALAKAAGAALGRHTLVAPGTVVGHVTTAWNASVRAVSAGTLSTVGWPGLPVHAVAQVSLPAGTLRAGEPLGTLSVTVHGRTTSVPVRAAASLPGPSATWKLTHL